MRHSSIDLTMNTYTDPKLLDVAGAVAALPELPLNATPKRAPEVAVAEGTNDREIRTSDVFPFAPRFVPTSDKPCISGATADKTAPTVGNELTAPDAAVSVAGDKGNRSPSYDGHEGLEIGARRFELPTSASRTQRSKPG